jgi:hypothetical protein
MKLLSIEDCPGKFQGRIPVEDFGRDREKWPTFDPGVYLVCAPDGFSPTFLEKSLGGTFDGDPTLPIAELKRRWVEREPILYIGKAVNLRTRICTLVSFGKGSATAKHRGGKALWQVDGCNGFTISWHPVPSEIDPEDVEVDLLDQFCATRGKLPFANVSRGRRKLPCRAPKSNSLAAKSKTPAFDLD